LIGTGKSGAGTAPGQTGRRSAGFSAIIQLSPNPGVAIRNMVRSCRDGRARAGQFSYGRLINYQYLRRNGCNMLPVKAHIDLNMRLLFWFSANIVSGDEFHFCLGEQ
jgi:hypothetical protein